MYGLLWAVSTVLARNQHRVFWSLGQYVDLVAPRSDFLLTRQAATASETADGVAFRRGGLVLRFWSSNPFLGWRVKGCS